MHEAACRWLMSLAESRNGKAEGSLRSATGDTPFEGIPPQDLSSTTQGRNLLGTVQEATVKQNDAVIMKTGHAVIIAAQNDRALSLMVVKAFICSKCLQLLRGRNQIQIPH